MTKAELLNLVKEGYRLDQAIKALNPKVKRLEEIKEILRAHANGEDRVLQAVGCVAEITHRPQPARWVAEEKLPAVRSLAGEFFDRLFCLAPCEKFTDKARALLSDKAEALLEAVGVKSGRVSFKKV